MKDFSSRLVDEFRRHFNSLIEADVKNGKFAEEEKHRILLGEFDKVISVSQKQAEEKIHIYEELEKTHSLSKNNPIWQTVTEAVEAVNKASPHQPITPPRAIIELPREELEKIGDDVLGAEYVLSSDVLILEKGTKISKKIIAHELGHKQQNLYDKTPDLTNVYDEKSAKKFIKEFSSSRPYELELRADLTAAKAFPNEGNIIDDVNEMGIENYKKYIDYNIAKLGIGEAIEKIRWDLLVNGIDDREETKTKHLKETLFSGGVNAWKQEAAEDFIGALLPTHPQLKLRHYIVQKELDTGLLRHLAYDEKAIIKQWQEEWYKNQPQKPSTDEILFDYKLHPKVNTSLYDAVTIIPPSASTPNNSGVKNR